MNTYKRVALAAALAAMNATATWAMDRLEGGNEIYRVQINVADGSASGNEWAGFYTAWTGPAHSLTAWSGRPAEVLSVRRSCATCTGLQDSNATCLRSYSSRTDYTLGNDIFYPFFGTPTPGYSCFNANDFGLPVVAEALESGIPTGVTATWEIHEGTDHLRVVELIRAHGEDLLSAHVEVTLSILNLGSASVLIGARNAWKPRINYRPSPINPGGGGAETWMVGLRPSDPPVEPYIDIETEWEPPSMRAWEIVGLTRFPSLGHPGYFIGGSVTGPATLQPPTTPPDLLQVAAANRDRGTGGPLGGAFDACFDWRIPATPRDLLHAVGGEASMTSYWGHDEAHAIELLPGEERSFTQHLVAYLEYPLGATTTGPYVATCTAGVARSAISGLPQLAEPTTGTLVYRWSSTDPTVTFDDPTLPDTNVQVAGPGVFPLKFTVSVGAFEASSDTTLTVEDVDPPRITDLRANPASLWPPNHRLVPVHVTAEVEDDCDPAPTLKLIAIRERDVGLTLSPPGPGNNHDPDWTGADIGTDDRDIMLRAERAGDGDGRIYTLEYEATDASGNTLRRTVQVTVSHDQRLRQSAPFIRR